MDACALHGIVIFASFLCLYRSAEPLPYFFFEVAFALYFIPCTVRTSPSPPYASSGVTVFFFGSNGGTDAVVIMGSSRRLAVLPIRHPAVLFAII
jgi:hypothetical protein